MYPISYGRYSSGHQEYDEDYDSDDDDDDDDDEYSYAKDFLSRFPEYTKARQLEKQIIFVRPDFSEENKDVLWCLTNGFEEVERGVWSGPWYSEKYGGSMEEAKKQRIHRLTAYKPKTSNRYREYRDYEDLLFPSYGEELFSENYDYEEDYYSYQDDDEDEYSYAKDFLSQFPEYTKACQLEENITFVRPDFSEEDKDILWCLTNDFEEVEPGVWSGPWYWRKHGGSMEEAKRKRIQRLSASKPKRPCRNVDDATFSKVLELKRKGNEMFREKRYKDSIRCYEFAHELGGMVGVLLEGEQQDEKVNILSNMSECYLRLGDYLTAGMIATQALQVNKMHAKSLLRRAKATFRAAQCPTVGVDFGPNIFGLANAEEDIGKIIEIGGPGVKEAQQLKMEIDAYGQALQATMMNQLYGVPYPDQGGPSTRVRPDWGGSDDLSSCYPSARRRASHPN